jgi:hypothetical protein
VLRADTKAHRRVPLLLKLYADDVTRDDGTACRGFIDGSSSSRAAVTAEETLYLTPYLKST